MTHAPLHRRLLAVLAVTASLLLVAGCGGDDGDDASDDATTTTTAAEEEPAADDGEAREPDGEGTDGEPADDGGDGPYAGHTSETYEAGEAWLCRPDLDDDVCRDLDVTVVAQDGSTTVEEREPDPGAPIDCFYVYPTVSNDPASNADMNVGPDDPEVSTVQAQAAQFGRACRVFAPIYRQATVGAIGDGSYAQAAPIAYGDVLDAWKTYIENWNDGRGVIAIGHSQGAGHLKQLVASEIDGSEQLRSRLVAAYLFGGAVQVPEGELVGGDFAEIPACTAADETGCVVTWSTYRADAPPVEAAIFGRAGGDVFGESEDRSARALCVDAVALLDRERASAVAPTRTALIGGIDGTEELDTPFVAFPDALEVSCERTDAHDFLAVGVPEGDERSLDGFLVEALGPTWGLHLVDMTVALDDLVELASRQGAAYAG